MKFLNSVKNFFVKFHHRFVDGSVGTKISHFIMGVGNLCHKQIIKGLLYFLIQIVFLVIMVLCPMVNNTPLGFMALRNLKTLGTNEGTINTAADDSRLMLLFGVVTIGIIVLYLFAWLSNIKSSYKADVDKREGKKPTKFIEDIKSLLDDRFHILMLTPTCIAALVFTILPTVFMILIAFTDFGNTEKETVESFFNWVGFDNFKGIFSTVDSELSRFGSIILWTFIWAFFATFTCYFAGIIVALLINKKGVRCKKLWRTIFILTIATPQFVSLLAVRNLLGTYGPINGLLQSLHITSGPVVFLGEVSLDKAWVAKVMVILINLWIGMPYTMLMTSGILMNIPSDLYEAATIDGATKTKMFTKITLPYILFVTGPYLISSFVGNITSFNIIYLLTGGGPSFMDASKAGATDLLVTWLYKLTIDEGIYNVGSVISIFTFLITASITLITYRRSKSYKQEDTFQ